MPVAASRKPRLGQEAGQTPPELRDVAADVGQGRHHRRVDLELGAVQLGVDLLAAEPRPGLGEQRRALGPQRTGRGVDDEELLFDPDA